MVKLTPVPSSRNISIYSKKSCKGWKERELDHRHLEIAGGGILYTDILRYTLCTVKPSIVDILASEIIYALCIPRLFYQF